MGVAVDGDPKTGTGVPAAPVDRADPDVDPGRAAAQADRVNAGLGWATSFRLSKTRTRYNRVRVLLFLVSGPC